MVTNRDVAQLLGLERRKQLLGCSDDDSSACLAELAGAIGAELMVTGSVVKVGSRFTATVRVLHLPGGQVLFSESSRADGEDALSDWLDEVARALPTRLRPAGTASPAPLQPSAWAPWLVVGAGAGVATQPAGTVELLGGGAEPVRGPRACGAHRLAASQRQGVEHAGAR